MKTQSPSAILSKSQRGFSMMELMIAITLGFIMVAAVGYLYLGSRQSFRTTDSMSRIQENARYALHTISQNVRMAGYIGCGNLQAVKIKTIANAPAPALTPATAITGLDTGVGATSYGVVPITRVAGDAVSIMEAVGSGANITGNFGPSNAMVQILGNPFNFQQGQALVVTNCTNADIFKVTNVPGSSGTVTLNHSNSSNTGNRLGTYDYTATVMRMEQYTYFIGTNQSGGRSLYRDSLTEGPLELADNVWDMQIQYGLDTNGDGTADSYSTATAITAWALVVSARINLLMVSQERVLSAAQTYRFFGDTATAPTSFTPGATALDRLLLHQVFTTTVGIRNRLL